jgi:tRNA (guanine-N7-)-methyltransferase
MLNDKPEFRRIRSYVLRQGRMTDLQEKAYQTYWNQWGVRPGEQRLNLADLFGREAPLVMEIGFGMGASLLSMARRAPEKNFIGIEVHRPGVGKLLAMMAEQEVTNIRIFCHDAVDVLESRIVDNVLERVQVFFPDPWHKTRHHKRRLIQPEFARLLHKKLCVGGQVHLATDWQNYARQMLAVMDETEGFVNVAGSGQYIPRPESRPLTKFEQRGQRLGHGVWDLLFEKIA